MGDIQLTNEQKAAVETSDKNILVSAAAGSGKTAVLAKRIARNVIEGKTSIEKLVVVTFTKAAASEMRAKIRKELEKELSKNPNNNSLYTQITLLQDANICTIDSFCQGILKTHFEEAGIDPDFRVAEDAEITLIQSEAFDEVMEDFHREGDPDFYKFLECYSGKKDDSDIEKLVNALYRSADANPWPDEWLDEMMSGYDDSGNIYDNKIIQYYINFLKDTCSGYALKLEPLIDEILKDENSISLCEKFAVPEKEMFKNVAESKDPKALVDSFMGLNFITFNTSNKCDDDLKKQLKAFREIYKKIKSENENFVRFLSDEKGLKQEINDTKPYIEILIKLTKAYGKKLDEAKREKNIVTFSDMEHLALNVLVNREDGKSVPTKAALDLRNYYSEIMVDEYQDTNMLQEEILEAISNGHNRYMVGDVKQSIYGFRKAKPDIFVGKYNTFNAAEDGVNQKIILQNNFRSREKILEGTNEIFSHVMKKEFCGINYGKDEMLVPSMVFPKNSTNGKTFEGEDGKIQIEYITGEQLDSFSDEVEAKRIGKRICELMESGYMVYDPDLDKYRNLKYKDIVILSRGLKNKTDKIVEILMGMGINAYADSQESYLEAYEIRPIISMLKVIDNPLDDIAMAAAMVSYFGGFDYSELALIRASDKDEFLYNNLTDYLKNGNDEGLKERVEVFLSGVNTWRERAVNSSVYDVLWDIVYNTGYYRYISDIAPAEKRLANINFLLNQAQSFSGSSFTGLFQFIKYIEKIKKAETEEGEMSILSENDDVVRIMTIHKSKGLEFPVVFLMGMSKEFKFDNENSKVMYHDDIGMATTDFNFEERTKKKTIFKNALTIRLKQDVINEEMRLLYVAMTRAREKLFMVGYKKRKKNGFELEEHLVSQPGKDFSYVEFFNINTYFKAAMTAILDKDNTSEYFDIRECDEEELNKSISETQKHVDIDKEEYVEKQSPFFKPYQYESEVTKKPKVTVTELKNAAITGEDDRARDYRPDSIQENAQEEIKGTKSARSYKSRERSINKGNAYHKLMECLDYNDSNITGQIEALISKGMISKEAAKDINIKDIEAYLESNIGKLAKDAFNAGTLYREREFMIGVKCDDMTDLLLVQGVIDMYIEEDDGIILLDYKTDYVKGEGAGEELIKRYKEQLGYYAKALEQATGKKVKEKIIYSFTLGEEIAVSS